MTGYRVCLDCDRRVYGENAEYSQHRHQLDGEVLIGCEGYRHKETENAIHENFSSYLEQLETKFLSYFVMEGWEYIVDNMVHDMNDPDDFGDDPSSISWQAGCDDEEIQATAALARYFEVKMEEITGHEYTMTRGNALHTIDDI